MKYFSLFICAVVFLICIIGYKQSRQTANAQRLERSVPPPTFYQTSRAELNALAKPPIATTVVSGKEPSRMGTDNSTVETMSDAFGNKVENRIFYNDELLKMVVLKTSADGQKQALIYGNNGDVKTAPPTLINDILNSAPREIAKSVGILDGRRENVMLARLQAALLAPPDNDSSPLDFSYSPINPIVNEIAPPTENLPTEETTQEPSETPRTPTLDKPESEKTEAQNTYSEETILRLRSLVQIPKANRPKPSEKDKNPQ